MTNFFNLPSKAGQDAQNQYLAAIAQQANQAANAQNQYLAAIAQHLGVTAGNLQDAINMANQANQAATAKITDLETRFQTLTAEQQHDAEVIDARDGETSLRARLDRDHADVTYALGQAMGKIKIITFDAYSGTIDLDTLTEPCLYRFAGAVSVINGPYTTGIMSDQTMLVTGGAMSFQITIKDGEIACRSSSWDGTFGPWYKIIEMGKIKIITFDAYSGTIDLDTLTEPCLYRFASAVSVINGPYTTGIMGDQTMLVTGGAMSFQITIKDGEIAYRSSYWDGTFGPWYKITGTVA